MLNPYLHKSSCFQSAIKETSRSQNKMGRTPIKPQKVVKKRVTPTPAKICCGRSRGCCCGGITAIFRSMSNDKDRCTTPNSNGET